MAYVGVDLGGTNTKLVLVDGTGDLLARGELPTRAAEGLERWRTDLAVELDRLVGARDIRGLGLSVAGLVDDRRRIVEAPNLRAFEGADVAGAIGTWRPGIRIVVENDVNCAVFGEYAVGAGRGCRHLAMLSLGTGVGGGIVVDGRLYRGAHGIAGELGHMIIDAEGPLCTCGRRGHVEAFLSTAAIVERARLRAGEAGERAAHLAAAIARGDAPEPRVLAECAREGCSLSREILAECGRWLGIACVNLAHALQPDRIVVGGGVSRAGDLILDPAREEFARRCMRAFAGTVPIVAAELGIDGAAVGAALLARADSGENLDAARS